MKLLLPLLLAATATGLTPGAYAVTDSPGQATLDGRPLGDLPYTPKPPERTCLSPAEARDPVALIRRQVPTGCTVARTTVTPGAVTLTGSCRPQASGLSRGSFRVSGHWTANGYRVDFTTENPSENGRMGFSGRIEARRVGAC